MEGDDREHLGVVVEATPIAIIVLDDRGHIALANEHAQLMFGYSADELRDREASGRRIGVIAGAAARLAGVGGRQFTVGG